MATKEDFLKLSMLPLERFKDPTLTVIGARDKWNETRMVVNAVRASGLTLGAQLQQSLDNLKHWIDSAMQAIHTFQTRGGSLTETVLQVEGLEEARQGFMNELPITQQLFAQVNAEAGQDTGTKFVEGVVHLTEPPKESKLMAVGLLLGGLYLVKVAFFD